MTASTQHNAANSQRTSRPDDVIAAIEAYLAERCKRGGRAVDVEHVETHLSHVFLCGESVFKLLKPVKFAFVDFSTVQRRRDECQAELTLNRPLAGDVYVSVEPVCRLSNGRLAIGGDAGRASADSVVDWVVVMRRLPADQTLDALVRRDEAAVEQLSDLAQTLVGYYRSAIRPPLSAERYVAAIERHVGDNLAELSRCEHGLPRHVVARVHAAQRTALATCAAWFEDRVASGRIVEGHGDLRPEHVYFMPHPTVIDCLAFSRDLRTLDVADEVAFLAMELDRLGAGDLAAAFIAAFERISDDRPPEGLWSFYRVYRACVRAKVAVLRAGQLGEPQQSDERAAARAYLELADRQSQQLQRPLCVVVRGLSGTGKSTLAAALAEKLGAAHLQTDRVRKQLFPGATPSEYGQGCYTTAARAMVYDAMLSQARELLAERIPVVLDGTFLTVTSRSSAVEAATRKGAATVMLVCGCPPEVAAQRLADRAAEGKSESDAGEATLRRQATEEEPDVAAIATTAIDTTQPFERQLDAALTAIRDAIPSLA
jgi:hypothetical protein